MATLNFTPKGNMRLATDADSGRAIFRIIKTAGGWLVQDYLTSRTRICCQDVAAARRAAEGIYAEDQIGSAA